MVLPELPEDLPRVPEFYAGRTIFITGFTGFMGKILVEKLLWSCPDIATIYVLMRDKRGLTLQQRIDKITNSELFSRLRERNEAQLKTKLIPVKGDSTLPGLGISPEVRTVLCEEVSIIFHCAASVRFDDPLTTAIDINLVGTKSVVDLALEMPNLSAFNHVSTAYSNCNRFDIEEKIYPSMADWKDTLMIRKKIPDDTLCIFNSKYTNHAPNTYVFAKSLGEQLVNDYADRIPVVIYRPSIVVCTYKEPFPGYIDNFNGPIGLMFGNSLGVVRTCLSNPSIVPDFIPVDVAIRGLLFTAYIRSLTKNEGSQVYNCCSRDRSIQVNEMVEMGQKILRTLPMKFMLWRPSQHTTDSKFIFYIYFVLFQLIPAIFVDAAIKLSGRKPLLVKVQRRIYIAMHALSYFSLNYFHFHNQNGYDHIDTIREEDLEEFNYYVGKEELDEYEFFYNGSKYAQKKFLKMTPEDVPRAKLLAQVMIWLDRAVKTCFWISLTYLVYKYEVIQTVLYGTINFLFKF